MASKSEEKRKLILNKAKKVFIIKGYSGVTMKDIIDECEISRGGIYLYFSSVEEIFKEVIKLHNKSKIDNIKSDMEKGKPFNELIDNYFDFQKERFMNMDKSLKSAMMGFFLEHKNEYSQSFISTQFDNSQGMVLEILKIGNEKSGISEKNLLTISENITLFMEGISTMALFTGLSEEFIDRHFKYIKQMIYLNLNL